MWLITAVNVSNCTNLLSFQDFENVITYLYLKFECQNKLLHWHLMLDQYNMHQLKISDNAYHLCSKLFLKMHSSNFTLTHSFVVLEKTPYILPLFKYFQTPTFIYKND